MDDKQFDPARNNEKAPAEGIAAVNTHNPGEERTDEQASNQAQEGPIQEDKIKRAEKE
jgi:hypothetical protein